MNVGEVKAAEDLAAIVAGIDEAVGHSWEHTLLLLLERDWPTVRAVLERAEEVADQGCEFCDSSVTDSMETGEPHAHWWGCGECWNKGAIRTSTEIQRLKAALRRMISAVDLDDDLKEAYDEAKALLAEPAPDAVDNSRKQDQS
jgi:hypothetical protein